MLLKEVNSHRLEKFGRLNKLIKQQFGFSISENIPYSKIMETMDVLNREIAELKVRTNLRESAEMTRLVLMRDALVLLRENFEMAPVVSQGNPYRSLLRGLVASVVDSVCLGDSLDDAVKFAMREYRSSKWRFPDDRVEKDLRSESRSQILAKCGPLSKPVMESCVATLTLTTDDMNAIHQWLSNSCSALPKETCDRVQTGYGQQGILPEKGQDADEFYANQLFTDYYAKSLEITPYTATKVNEMKSNIVKRLRTLLETEVAEAEIIATARSFASEVQEMIEKLSRLQNEELPPLTDSMKEEYGIALANNFHSKSQAALQGALEALYSAKDEIDNSVISIATGKDISNDMDVDISNDPAMSADPDVDKFDSLAGLSRGDDDEADLGSIEGMEDEFSGADAMTGDEEPLGRAMRDDVKRESVERMKKAIMEMEQRIANLSKKKTAN